jgi:predicted transcriptional regulator
MTTLRDGFHTIKERVMHLWHPHTSVDDAIAGEQIAQEEQVDLVMNPWLGVVAIRHPVSRHPRRA